MTDYNPERHDIDIVDNVIQFPVHKIDEVPSDDQSIIDELHVLIGKDSSRSEDDDLRLTVFENRIRNAMQQLGGE